MLAKHLTGRWSALLTRLSALSNLTRVLALACAVAVAFIIGSVVHDPDEGAVDHELVSDTSGPEAGKAQVVLRSLHPHQAVAKPAQRKHANQQRAASPFGSGRHLPVLDTEQQNIARFLAKRYRLALGQTQFFVENAYRTAREFRVDPLLILAVISIESNFDPRAESHVGAQGLMQVLTRVHVDKFEPFGGVKAAFDPVANIKVGVQILKDYIGRAGSVEGALKYYVGAALLPHDGGYAAKVLGERARIAAAARGHIGPVRQPRRVTETTAQAQTTSAKGQARPI